VASARLDEAGASVAGPVGILGVIFPSASEAGLTQVVFLAAIISLTLAVMNALPIPSLDGGRWFVTAAFRLFKKPLTKEREESIHGTGFAAMMVLFLVITVADVFKFF
jgi:regulator of sigma E protease